MKKPWFVNKKLIFVICVLIVCLITWNGAFTKEQKLTTEKYGTTSDSSIPIDNDSEVKIKFKITENNFDGIFVRLTAQTRDFEEEKLCFSMYDNDTGHKIAEYDILLSNEMYNSNTYVVLPYENSKNKSVTIYITGENINKIPYLNISDNENVASQLYVDGELQEKVLVFSGVYVEDKHINYEAIIQGLIFILFLVLVFGWEKFAAQMEKQEMTNHKKDWFSSVRKGFTKHKKAIVFFIASFFYIGVCLFIYDVYVKETVDQKQNVNTIPMVKEIQPIELNCDSKEAVVAFKSKHEELSALYYHVEVDSYTDEAKLHVIVSNNKNGNVYYDDYIPVKQIAKDKQLEIFLEKEFTDSANQMVKVVFEPMQFENTSILLKAGSIDRVTTCWVDGTQLNKAPALKTSYANNDFLIVLFLIYAVFIYLFGVLVYMLFIVKKVPLEQAFIPVVLSLGILYMFAIPLYTVPDEYTHIDTVYSISNQILGIEEPDKFGYMYKRTCDLEPVMMTDSKARITSYRRIYTSLFEKADDTTLVECYSKSALSNASELYYLPAAVGLSVARMLNWGCFATLMFGRFCNLFVYVMLGYWALKKIPFMRNVLFVIASLPITLQEAASFSYDSMLNAVVFVFLAECFYCIKKSNIIHKFDIITLFFLLMQLSYVKGGVYLPLCFLVVLIPYERCWKLRGKLGYYTGVLLMIMTSFMKSNIASLINRFQATQSTSINGFTGGEMYTFGYLLNHPLETINLYANTLFVEGDEYIQGVLGGELGVFQLYMPWATVIFTLIVLLYFCIDQNNRIVFRSKITTIWIGILTFASFMLVCLSMLVAFTTTNYNYIEGVQGRYFVPILILPFVLLTVVLKNKVLINSKKMMMLYSINHIICLFSIIMIVLQ